MLLGSKQSTDILEAIDFFVSAFEFGVQNSMLGVRRMLSLIWSGEATIREAVVAAYKRLYIEVCISVLMTKITCDLTSSGSGAEGRGAQRSSGNSSELFSSGVRGDPGGAHLHGEAGAGARGQQGCQQGMSLVKVSHRVINLEWKFFAWSMLADF